MPWRKFAEAFTFRYQRLAKHRVDPGMLPWDKGDSLFSVFDDLYKSLVDRNTDAGLLLTLCAVYGPWSIPISLLRGLQLHDGEVAAQDDSWGQLQTLLHDDIELKSAIEELCRVFLAKKQQDKSLDVLSVSLHPSVCQWRFETLGEQTADWIMQASTGLVRHIESTTTRQQ